MSCFYPLFVDPTGEMQHWSHIEIRTYIINIIPSDFKHKVYAHFCKLIINKEHQQDKHLLHYFTQLLNNPYVNLNYSCCSSKMQADYLNQTYIHYFGFAKKKHSVLTSVTKSIHKCYRQYINLCILFTALKVETMELIQFT